MTKDDLLKRALMQSSSISWHQEELRKTLNAIKTIENKSLTTAKDQEYYSYLQQSLVYLLEKGLFEQREIDKTKKFLHSGCFV